MTKHCWNASIFIFLVLLTATSFSFDNECHHQSTLLMTSSFAIPNQEYSALQALYSNTNGANWNWAIPSNISGYPWNFTTSVKENPCSSTRPWQGISCSSTCENSPCNVLSLILSGLNLQGIIPVTISQLTKLEVFDLSENKLINPIPWSAITSSWSNLQNFSLESNRFVGQSLPSSIGLWTELRSFDIEQNFFTGTLYDTIGYNLTKLVYFDINNNLFEGTIPESLSNLQYLTYLGLFKNKFQGTIPHVLGKLINLQYFYLNDNQLVGTIPDSLGNLINCMYFDVASNHLVGSLPASMGNMVQLVYLDVDTNKLTGPIPNSLGNLINLLFLDLNYNEMTGTIPISLGNLTQMIYMDLDYNDLTGTIPSELGALNLMLSLYLDNCFLTGTLPPAIGNCSSMTNIFLHNNMLYGEIPASYGQLVNLLNLYLYNNELTSTIPWTAINMTSLNTIYINNNQFIGEIPSLRDNINMTLLFVNVQHNYFTGNIMVSLNCKSCIQLISSFNLFSGNFEQVSKVSTYNTTMFPRLQSLDISNNMFSGTIPTSNLFNSIHLEVLYLNSNQFTGTIPDSLFSSAVLEFLVLSLNCFSGTLPNGICNLHGIEQIFMDGLHSASSCVTKFIPFIESSGFIVKENVQGTIPSCIFAFPELMILHLGGNSLTGPLPELKNHRMQELVVSHNLLTGSIPQSVWNSSLTSIDLSFNRLQGTIPTHIFPTIAAATSVEGYNMNGSVNLQVNELSGTVPSVLWDLNSVNVLEGNLFSCNSDRSNIPKKDPNYQSYNCGSDATNYALVTFIAGGCIAVFLTWLTTSTLLSQTRQQSYSPSKSYLIRWWDKYYESLFDDATVEDPTTGEQRVTIQKRGSMFQRIFSFSSNDKFLQPNLDDELTSVERGLKMETVLRKITSMNVLVSGYVVTVALIVYSVLSIYYTTYTFTYLWTVTSVYMGGIVPAVVVFFLFIFLLGIVLFQLVPYLPSMNVVWLFFKRAQDKKHRQRARLSKRNLSSDSIVGGPMRSDHDAFNARSISTDSNRSITSSVESDQSHDDEEDENNSNTWRQNLWATAVVLFNIIIVTLVNGSYVLAVRSGYTLVQLIFISFLLSNFKVMWNYLILGGWESEKLHELEAKLTDKAIVWLCLFNNLFAPLLAETLVSSDCFVYLISEAPKLTFYYADYACANYMLDGFFVTVCNVNLLTYLRSDRSTSRISFIPPFHYSYQCSFSLMSDYVYVFIFRYLVCGILEPMIVMLLKSIVTKLTKPKMSLVDATVESANNVDLKTNDSPKSQDLSVYMNMAVPILWKLTILRQKISKRPGQEEDASSESPSSVLVVTDDSLRSMEMWLSKKGKIKRKMVTRCVTDFSILLAFGVLCPPLAFVVMLSIVKDCSEVRLALGRIKHAIHGLRKGNNEQNRQICYRLEVLYGNMIQEIIDAEPVIWMGVWYSICIAVLIWAFVLFDILSPTIGVLPSLSMVVLMAVSPYVWRYIHSTLILIRDRQHQAKNENRRSNSRSSGLEDDMVQNVMFEMTETGPYADKTKVEN